MLNEFFGYLSGLAILASFFPYIRDIFLGKTKPERMSWLIWAVLGSIAFFSQFAKGASWSLIFTGAQTAGDLVVFILAIKYGLGGFVKRDFVAFIGVGASLLLWYFTREALVALFVVIFIDAIGAFLTTLKSFEQPETETKSAWIFTFLGGLLGCFAVGEMNFILLAFPFYICLASASILLAIELGIMKRKISK
ncbi:MAG: hypothetical protein HGA61_04435 [Candidatus Moranbacteria bacterium]|nr:hypothetical protein [Candidatus Moranbacteria bacterium]